ncbi:hypothetical protein SERLADRAFT_399928 [Serpula lacrymans var. lacrymans S7.9]|nr:uncharacterized protein SERLADRAFT_399928 [Serpula lacrymans var. lacrymans S7.9]EGO20747.1 hypothetical protein SERLADRAFT_399928 [Serpula lacrymans var. lacrymans S7.9]
MCYNIIQYVEYACSHRFVTRRQKVDCNDKKCRFSNMHNAEEHNCINTCLQSMMAAQGLVMDTDNNSCSGCLTNGTH